MRSYSSTHVEPCPLTPNLVTIIPGPSSTRVEPFSSTSNPVRRIPGPAGLKVVEDVGEDANFISGAWVSATNYVIAFGGTVTGCLGDIENFLKKGKLEQVVAIVKSCYPNALGDLNVTLKDLSGTVPGTIHYKVLDMGSYGKDITVGAAIILANVSVFTPKPSEHYLNITKRNVVEVFRKDTVSLV
ncbi:transposase, MuDR, MULE transposase domain protein [Tanacetum coccineum]